MSNNSTYWASYVLRIKNEACGAFFFILYFLSVYIPPIDLRRGNFCVYNNLQSIINNLSQ